MAARELVNELRAAVDALDRTGAGEVCDRIVSAVELGEEPFPVRHAGAHAPRSRRKLRLGARLPWKRRAGGQLLGALDAHHRI